MSPMSLSLSYFLLNFLIVFKTTEGVVDFCELKCGSEENTACKRKPCYPNKKCGSNFEMLPLNDEQRGWVVEHHNYYRQEMATNATLIKDVNGATNMNVLSYSKEVEFVAQCWANDCASDGPHDKCRAITGFNYVGQNVFRSFMVGSGYTWEVTSANFKEAIRLWFVEYEDTTVDTIKSFPPSSPKVIGHFTQLVWAETTLVGCGLSRYGDGDNHNVIFVCNYATGGNIVTMPVFSMGPGCTACKSGTTCNKQYTALCGNIRPLSEDTFVPPFKLAGSRTNGNFKMVSILVVVWLTSWFLSNYCVV